jgi:hypothetical protein
MHPIAKACLFAAACLSLSPALAAQDLVTLKNGQQIQGLVVDETQSQVSVQTQSGVQQISRARIQKIQINADNSPSSAPAAVGGGDDEPSQAAPSLAPTPSAQAQDLYQDLAQRYQVPVSEVLWVHRQGIVDADLPLVFFIAAKAEVTPGPVVRLHNSGLSWEEVERHYNIEPKSVRFVPGPFVPIPSPELVEASILWPLWLLRILTHHH